MSCTGYMLIADLDAPPRPRKCLYLMFCGQGPRCRKKSRTETFCCVSCHTFLIFKMFCICFLKLFLCGPVFFVFIECVTILLVFVFFVFRLHGKWGLISPTREAPTSTVLESEVPTTGPQEIFERYKLFKILNFFTYI